MKYGKIRIEDGYLAFSRHMMLNSLPCKDIMWAYLRREGEKPGGGSKQIISNYLVIVTRRKKRYKFDMTEKEVHECLTLLKALNPELAVGFPKGGRLALQSLPNTRDLGAISTADGRQILPRKLLRSGELYHASMADRRMLSEEYHLRTVIDFRSGKERREKPDPIFQGVEYYHIPIMDEDGQDEEDGRRLLDMVISFDGNADWLMRRQYENFIKDPYSLKQYARFLDVLCRQKEGAVLWHCSQGKDRVGVGTALLLCALGVSREAILEDYLHSNAYLEEELNYLLRYLEATGQDTIRAAENVSAFYKVKAEYLEVVFETIEKEYGSVERFLRKGLYLTNKAIEGLQEKYLI